MTGLIWMQSWAGRTSHPIEILKETPKRYLIRHLDTALSWRMGKEHYVPKYAVDIDDHIADPGNMV